jgi:hypothetical protein
MPGEKNEPVEYWGDKSYEAICDLLNTGTTEVIQFLA